MRLRRVTLLGGGLAVALAGPALATAYADAVPEPRATANIIGGSTVSSAPWSVQVYRNGSFTCSGSLIAPQWALTAKHCVGAGLSVRVGNVMRGQGTAANVVSYHNAANGSDISLLRLDRAAGSSFTTLATSVPPANATNQIFGWGKTSYNGSISPQLKTADVRVTNTNCRDAYNGQAICSTRITGAAWSGDSGGPQFYNGQQVGVASTADGGSTQQYTAVAPNRSWILSLTGGGSTTPPSTPPTTGPTPPTTPPTSQPPGGTTWRAGAAYQLGTVVTYDNARYRCVQPHAAQQGWEPPNTPSLWQRI